MFEGSITALITPFHKDGSIDFDTFKKLIAKQRQAGTDGIVVSGTTGECPTLTQSEFDQLVEIAVGEKAPNFSVIVNGGTNNTQQSVDRAKYAEEKGADGFLAIVPYYNHPSIEGVIAHFEAIAKVGIPTILYHHPRRTGIFLDVDTMIRLTNLDAIVAVKDCSGDITFIKELIAKKPKAAFLTGNDTFTLEFIEYGGRGAISIIGNIIPKYWKEMVHAALSKDYERAEDLLENVRKLLWAIELEPNPQGIKAAASKLGLCENILRLPMVPASQVNQQEIDKACEDRTLFQGKPA